MLYWVLWNPPNLLIIEVIKMKILVIGEAGYIGSHTFVELLNILYI